MQSREEKEDRKLLHIEIAYLTPQKQMLVPCTIVEGTTVQEAILQSHILNHFSDIDLAHQKVGVFSKIVPLSHILSDKDRVEIYRPLIVDPKQSRKARANNNFSI